MKPNHSSPTAAPIQSVNGLIAALGGTRAVALWLDIDQSAVRHWRRLHDIPSGWHLRLHLECQRRSIDVDLVKVFGLVPDEGDQAA